MNRKSQSKWFLLNRRLHRDLGYLAVALTIVFAVSGIALNHRDDWNPNYIVETQQLSIELSAQLAEPELQRELQHRFDNEDKIKASYWQSPNIYKLFFANGGTLTANFSSQMATLEKISSRPVFKQFNTLHLNEMANGWLIISDIYAGVLLFLAISGLFMVKGNNSPWRKKKAWLLLLGSAIPAIYIAIMLNTN